MKISASGHNFGGISVWVEDGGLSFGEHFTKGETEAKDTLSDQMLSVSWDLAGRDAYPSNSEWLKLVAAYLDSEDIETLAELVKAEGR